MKLPAEHNGLSHTKGEVWLSESEAVQLGITGEIVTLRLAETTVFIRSRAVLDKMIQVLEEVRMRDKVDEAP